ncbi:histo-blood group ABO system transferase 2-like isoform X1 [Brachyhypopomus gauderio]|uniref:histo-blood group ABO system transferase 2-like isoform X1 n=1 Tax=Brachyhypopomus gauderio TaxID=698409 RepID=UPI004041FA35
MKRNIYLFVLVLADVLIIGCIYYGFVSSWFSVVKQRNQMQTFTRLLDRHLELPKGVNYKQPDILNGRKDVVTVTPWLAPIVWEGTFDTNVLDAIYKPKKITVATTVFAMGKYIRFLKDFLETAEKYYMVGYRVRYFIFTDRPEEMPVVPLGQDRNLTTITVPSLNRWQDISLGRMLQLEQLIENQLVHEVEYIFSLDVDTKFHGHWGAETLDRLVAAVHHSFYNYPRDQFTYERRPESQAYIPYGQGDYYYCAAMVGGKVEEVYRLVQTCRIQLDIDKSNSIEAIWQEESHFNHYLLYNKPSKVLSPEYMWIDLYGQAQELKVIRYSHVLKNKTEVRPN